jgi:hypothetical protein
MTKTKRMKKGIQNIARLHPHKVGMKAKNNNRRGLELGVCGSCTGVTTRPCSGHVEMTDLGKYSPRPRLKQVHMQKG